MLVPGAAKALSVLLVVMLFLSSMFVLSLIGGSGSGEPAPDADGREPAPSAAGSSGSAAWSDWDWDAYVDKLGNVRVMLFTESSEALDAVMDRAAREIDPGSPWPSDGTGPSWAAVKGQLGQSMLSVEIRPGVLRQLLANEPSLTAYPDLKVNATGAGPGVIQIGADRLWETEDTVGDAVTGLGVTVAVIDTGIDYTHPDLGGGFGPGYKVAGGYDFVNDDSDPKDDNGHGTHVAGIIAADGEIQGVAPGATLYAYKALGADGSGFMSDVVLSIDAALDPNGDGSTEDHLDVISMSLGGDGDSSDPICQAVKRATEAGVLVVVAAGNSGPTVGTVSSPGISSYALTVGAVDSEHRLANFSSRGPTDDLLIKPDISAPGVAILSTVPYSGASGSSPTGYREMSGTSMATPHVSGAAALLIQNHPSWTVGQVKSALITGASQINESLWEAGAGEVWVPGADETLLFASNPLISFGKAGSGQQTVSVTNADGAASFVIKSGDWFALSADGADQFHVWSNYSRPSPTTMSLGNGASGQITLYVEADELASEGYFDGYILMDSTNIDLKIPFGFIILSELRVRVWNMDGREVLDPYGGVWVYSIPDANIAIGKRGGGDPSPPASFMLPSGTYSVHSAGHQLTYTYSDPYFLSDTVTVGRLETRFVNLSMTDAREVVIDLTNDEGSPIYVKDFRMHARYQGERNLSFDVTGSDYSIFGPEMFSLPPNRSLRLSDTAATVGIQLSGFSYSSAMWEFMDLNKEHWYEFKSGASTAYLIEATADLQYLLAWEFPVVDSLVPSTLTYDLGSCGVYETRYDIPGTVQDPWCNWDTHRAMGGDAAFYVRRDTDTSLNPFFSGMTRTTVVSGVFSELYFPRSIFGGYIERSFYEADYSEMLHAATISEIYLPNRYFLTPLDPVSVTEVLGSGPFYPSVRTQNTDSSLVLFHPLLRDQNGWRVGGVSTPMLNLYRNGMLSGIYQLSEHLSRPEAMRIIEISDPGSYTAEVSYSPSAQLYDEVFIELGFTVPAADMDPPTVTGMSLQQRFVAGDAVPLSITAEDPSGPLGVDLRWRAGAGGVWTTLPVTDAGGGVYTATIQTGASASQIDIDLKVSDADGNYLRYIAYNASMEQVPVVFQLYADETSVEYKNYSTTVHLSGQLTDASGNPIHQTAGIPLELVADDGTKVGMILDEAVEGTAHTHDGTISYDWMVRPMRIFEYEGDSVTITAKFDLGIYEPVTQSFTLTSIPDLNIEPNITLVSPAIGDTIPAGTTVDIEIEDDGTVTAQYSLDGGQWTSLPAPWDISTAGWTDGNRTLEVKATDDDFLTVSRTYWFDVDALDPVVVISDPLPNATVPRNHTVVVSVSDARLTEVTCSVDGGAFVPLAAPYTISTVGWAPGNHTVEVVARDAVGHESSAFTHFQIADTSVVVQLDSPADGAVIKAGTMLMMSVIGDGTFSCTWDDGSGPLALDSPYDIPTDGWAEGEHSVNVAVLNDLGDSFGLTFEVTIDNTAPVISLSPPTAEGAYLTNWSVIVVKVTEVHLGSVTWTLWGVPHTVTVSSIPITLMDAPMDGPFTLSVSATDQAGNVASEDFTFVLDTAPPTITVEGKAEVLAPEDTLTIVVEDDHLAEVLLTVDGTQSAISATHSLSMDIGLGPHVITIVAKDLAGNDKKLDLSIQVDGVLPDVTMSSGDQFDQGSAFEVSAALTDDVGIAGATLFYSLPGGGFLQLPMSYNGVMYVTTLAAEAMWDGMEIYVVAVDMAGNTATGPTQVLHESGQGGGGEDDDASVLSWLFGDLSGLLIVGAIIASVVVLTMFMIFRRKDEESTWELDLGPPSRPEPKKETAAEPPPAAPVLKIEPPAYTLAAEGPKTPPAVPAPRPVEPELPKRPMAESVEVPKMRKVSLMEAIPEPVLAQEDQNQRFYNQLLDELDKVERELNENARRGSVFREDEEFDKAFDLEERLETGKPKQVSGLKWKKLME